MAENTAISWADSTWSPWEGCTKISPGCDNCYAARQNRWLKRGANWGPGAPRLVYGDDHWDKPVRWQRNALKFHTLHGRNRRVFPSVCDPFDNEAYETERQRFFGLIGLTPNLTWLLLTKRIGNVKGMAPRQWLEGEWPANVWLGATVVNRDEMLRDGPKLKTLPAPVTFWSYEPALGPLGDIPRELMPSWCVAGGESGPGARPWHPMWARSLRDQCAAAGVPFHWKQHGEWLPITFSSDDQSDMPHRGLRYIDRQGESHDGSSGIDFFGGDEQVARIGAPAAGRLLDGIEHNAFPQP